VQTAAGCKTPVADARAETDAAKRGVTAARVAALTAAITNFKNVMNAPRGQIVNRSALLREVETDVAGLLEKVAALDDLVVQFDGSAAGKRFLEAWKRARIIMDAGHGPGEEPKPTEPAQAPAV
jgi:hypothetical protein